MKRENRMIRWTSLGESPPVGVPLVEILDCCRVLVENHQGIIGYDSCEIRVKTRSGMICVCGECLMLSMMCRQKLVITGRIQSVTMQGRG